ncbi:MAG: hypothetical protein EPN39_20085 [Chitinophagaceae bacterium]|nr:MAG: hypothetical protein EPN39_20085 [Chitinophagaceae bacterium]
MKKYYILLFALVVLGFCAGTPAFAQQSVLNPNDTLVNYDPANPPALPTTSGVMIKWIRDPKMGWNTSPYKAYFYSTGNQSGVPFRLLFPKSYGTDPNKIYPLLIFFHGAGEISRNGYYDNELQLANCAQTIMNAVSNGSFDGFVLFPQTTSSDWINLFPGITGIINYMVANDQVDISRIIVSGLSMGGHATWDFAERNPGLVAGATPISADPYYYGTINMIDSLQNIPIWLSQGGLDTDPYESASNQLVSNLRNAGLNVRYTVYPNSGHGVWNAHYAEPDAFSWMLNVNKTNPHVYYGQTLFCTGSPISDTLGITAGFQAYQWSKNGVTIPGATSNILVVTDTGTYAARYMVNGQWTYWSPTPVTIIYRAFTQTPPITVAGLMSRVIPAPDGNTSVTLAQPSGYVSYTWKNAAGQVVGRDSLLTTSQPGNYVATVTELTGCPAKSSDSFYVASASGPNPPSAASALTAFALSQTSVQLNWSRNPHPVNNETGFEVYRATQSGGPYQLAGIAPADTVQFTDNNLTPNTKYFYIVRAIDSTGAAPVSRQDSVVTFVDKQPPTAPGNLTVLGTTPNSVSLQWSPSTDNVSVQNYYVYINGVRTYVTAGTAFTVNNLTYKQYYTFTIKAVDPSGNISAPSNQVVTAAVNRGLKYRYYTFTGTWNNIPNLSSLSALDSGMINNITLSPATQTTNFAFSFKGYINIRIPGTYTFYTNSDDGSNLYINGTQVVNNDGQHAAQAKSGTYSFSQTGLYPFEVDYFQQGGGYSLTTSWQASSLGIPQSQIPDSAFTETDSLQGTVPVMPSSITAKTVSYNQINLNWTDNSNNETGFEIYRASVSAGPWQIIYTTKANMTAFTDSTVSPSTTYYYKVQAVNQYGSSGFASLTQNNAATTLPLPPAPPVPGLVTAVAVSVSQINLTWTDTSTNLAGYNIYRSDVNNTGFRKLQQVPAGVTSYSDSTLFSNTTYYYKISATNTGGTSGYSDTAYATTLNQIPVVSSISNQYIRYDTTTVISISAVDSDGDALTLSTKNLPSFGSLHDNGDGTGTLAFSPSPLQGGTYSNIRVFAIDQHGGVDSVSFTLSVGANNPPVIKPIPVLQVSTFNTATDTIFVSDQNTNVSLTWQIAGLPSFIDTSSDNRGNLILNIQPGASDTGNYSFAVSVTDNYGGVDRDTVSLSVNYLPLKKWYINFASNYAWMTYPGSPWNNVRSDTATNFKDGQGNSSSVGLQLNTNWWATQMVGAQTGNNSGIYSDTVMRDNYYFGILGGPNSVSGAVTGLDTTKTYSITFFGSSTWQGTKDNGYTVYQIGSRADSIHVQNNTSQTVTFSNLTPAANGSIPFTMRLGANASGGFINAMVVTTDASISPATPLNPQLSNVGANGHNAIQISWQQGSTNTDSVEIYRSTGVSGPYTLINPGMANGYATGYVDTGISSMAANYYYYLIAANAYGRSKASDTVSMTTSQYVDKRKWYINFASNYAWMTYPGSPWNNVRSDTATNFKDDQGNSSSVGLQLNTNWWATQMVGAQTGNNSGAYSDTVMRDDYYFGILGGPGSVSGAVTGLDTTKTYSITFFGSSTWQGTRDNGYTVYQIGSRADSIHVQNNTSQTVTFSNLKPGANGSVPFTMRLGANASGGFINAIVVSTDTKALPTTPLNVQVSSKTVNGGNAVQVGWQLASTNATTIEIYRSKSESGQYILLDPDSSNGYKTSYVDDSVSSGSTYFYYLVAANAYGSSATSDTVSITIPQYIDNRKWYINFATDYGWMSYPGSPWNNVRSGTMANLIDNQGNSSTVGLQLQTSWWATYTNGTQTGNNSGVYPDNVMRDYYYFGISGGPNTVTGMVTGLDTSKTYSITFFGSSTWQITPDNGYTDYQIGSQIDSIHVQGNTNQTVTFSNLKPAANGSITFTMSKGAGASAGFINAMVVTTYSAYPPASPINFHVKNEMINNNSAAGLSWQPGSNNTDTVKIYRATTPAGTYTLLNPGIGNGNAVTYTDTAVSLGTTYYYYLVAANAYGNSLPTDTLSVTSSNVLPGKPLNVQLSNAVVDSGKVNAVGVSWQQGSANADTIQVYRSTSKAGSYSLLNPGMANGSSTGYQDITISLGTTYYYYLVAVNAFGNSGPTDTVSITTNAAPLPPPVISSIPTLHVSGGLTDTLTVSASASGANVTFTLQQAPSFISVQSTGDSSASLILSPQTTDYGYYDSIQVVANASNGTSSAEYFNVYVDNGGVTQVINLNFTDAAHAYPGNSWNNLNFINLLNNQFNNLINNFGQTTRASVTMINTWSGAADYGADTYNNSGFVPDSVMTSYYFMTDTASRNILISGLDTSKRYNLVFFASSNNGGNTDYTTNYTVNGQTVSLNGIRNTSKSVRINGIQPNSSGNILLSVAMGSTASQGILNAMTIESYNNGAIIAPANLIAVANGNNVSLTWSDRSYNEQQFQIWRAQALNGTYTNIANVPAGSTSYVDNTVAADTRYFYKVFASNTTGQSQPSNIASVTTPKYAVYVNFNNMEAPAPAPWNNTQTTPQPGAIYGPLFDSKGNNSGITLNMIVNFEGENSNGVNTGNNSGIYPDLVMQSALYLDNGLDTISMQVSGLDLSKEYDLTFFGSITGWGWINTTQFIANGQLVSLETSYNSSNTVTLKGLTPDQNGQIMVKIIYTSQSRFAILNAMIIKGYTNYDNNGNPVINPNLFMFNRGMSAISQHNIMLKNDTASTLALQVLKAYPNPFSQSVNIIINSGVNDQLILSLVGSNGAVMDRQLKSVFKGINSFRYQPYNNATSGFYILNIRSVTTGKSVSVKLIKQ